MKFNLGITVEAKEVLNDEDVMRKIADAAASGIVSICTLAVGAAFLVKGKSGSYRLIPERNEVGVAGKVTILFENVAARTFDAHATVTIDDAGNPTIRDWMDEETSGKFGYELLKEIVANDAEWVSLEITPA